MTHNELGKLIRDSADQIVHEGPRFDTEAHALRAVTPHYQIKPKGMILPDEYSRAKAVDRDRMYLRAEAYKKVMGKMPPYGGQTTSGFGDSIYHEAESRVLDDVESSRRYSVISTKDDTIIRDGLRLTDARKLARQVVRRELADVVLDCLPETKTGGK